MQPLADGRGIRVLDVVHEALGMGLKAPMVIRFQDLLRFRVKQLNDVFAKAIKDEGYKGEYRGVYPIKVNQLHEVVQEILEAGRPYGFGLECGSKAELVAALPHLEKSKAPAVVIGRQNRPSQKARPSIGAIDSQISSPFTRLGSHHANPTPAVTTATDAIREAPM